MTGQLVKDAAFASYTPLASNAEISRRVVPPLTRRRLEHELAAKHLRLADQAIDLAKEKFDIYVPPGVPPAAGWGVLVFVAPWSAPTRPEAWRPPLDRHHLIFVSAQDSGNGSSVLDRRLPLALLAYANVRERYPIDPSRVYITGLSGGSRVAETAALAYPDVFRGVILNAGSDPIDGRAGIYKPPAELFRQFQRSRVVFITGDQDWDNLSRDNVAIDAMRAACVLDLDVEYARGLAHQPLDMPSLSRALDALEAPHHLDESALARCNDREARAMAAALAAASATIDRGDRTAAREQLNAIDARYAGLAAPQLLDLLARLEALP